MGVEIERKFLLSNDSWKSDATGKLYRQGYLTRESGCTVRVRTVETQGYLTIKGPTRDGSKLEFEYEIPIDDAREMLSSLAVTSIVEKQRYVVEYEGFTWEIDVFSGDNRGLVVAEIELSAIDQAFPRPPWIGREVTDQPRYYNASLAHTPYCGWPEDER